MGTAFSTSQKDFVTLFLKEVQYSLPYLGLSVCIIKPNQTNLEGQQPAPNSINIIPITGNTITYYI